MDPKILAVAGLGGIALLAMSRRASADESDEGFLEEDESDEVFLEEDEYTYNGETYQRDPVSDEQIPYEEIPPGVTPPPPPSTEHAGLEATPADLQNALNAVIARYGGRFESRFDGRIVQHPPLTVDGIVGPATRHAYIIVRESTIGTDLPMPRNVGFRDENFDGVEFTLDPRYLNSAVYQLTALA